MIASAESSPDRRRPRFLIATDVAPHNACWAHAAAQMEDVQREAERVLGFAPCVKLTPIDNLNIEPGCETFVFPAPFDLSLDQRERIGQALAEARRDAAETVVHHDDVDCGHPLIVGAMADQVSRAIATSPRRTALLLAASGHGDPAGRAETYRLARLIWEELGLARVEVGFVRHAEPFLQTAIERCYAEPLDWLIVAESQWENEHVQYARVILDNLRRASPAADSWRFVDPPAAHPMLTAWFAQRITRLWQAKRERETLRIASPRHTAPAPETWNLGCGIIARTPDRASLAEAVERILPAGKPERVLVKVTWHGYATGTYTDPAALDLLLDALPAPAVVIEGHTTSRNLGGVQFRWETHAQDHRAWIRQQEAEYLRRTGLAQVLARHDAQYINVTEAFWDEEYDGDALHFIPRLLLEFRGCPLISFAKFKGPTRLGISNMFGLIPHPLRDAWHGPNITWFARACCRMAKLYGSEFELCSLVEGLYSAVRWNRSGVYRSRWGNYDLVRDTGIVTASRGLVSADILASRLQGQDVSRSAFFEVVREELGWDNEAATILLPESLETVFA